VNFYVDLIRQRLITWVALAQQPKGPTVGLADALINGCRLVTTDLRPVIPVTLHGQLLSDQSGRPRYWSALPSAPFPVVGLFRVSPVKLLFPHVPVHRC
jgi:hypothetical protein